MERLDCGEDFWYRRQVEYFKALHTLQWDAFIEWANSTLVFTPQDNVIRKRIIGERFRVGGIMESNTAIVGKLTNLRPIEGADKIMLANVTVNGVTQAQVVVGVETQEGQLVVYFTSNMCLSDTVIKEYPDLARYLGRAGRVRTIKLRGVISDGFATEVEKFKKWTSLTTLVEGYDFTSLGATEICHRYQPPVKTPPTPKEKGRKVKKFNRLIENQVRLHYDTNNLRRNAHKIQPDDIISITRKLHGTSATAQHVLVKRPLNIFEKILKKFGIQIVETMYDYIYTSRTVVKNANLNIGVGTGFYGHDLWTDVGKEYFFGKLFEGESVYYEIVGHLPSGSAIQKGYPYGTKQGECAVYVYRITKTGTDGKVVEYTWPQLLERCAELGVKPVFTFFYGKASDEIKVENWDGESVVGYLEVKYLGKKAHDCNGRPDEGIVVKKDGLCSSEAFKLKDPAFIAGESAEFEKGTEDIEESS